MLWFALFIWIGFTTEVATGFGSIIIALALGTLVLPIDAMLPVLVALNVVMNSVLLLKLHKQIDKGLFLKGILPLMAMGMVIGIAIFPYLPETLLKTGFALLILWFASKELLAIRGQTLAKPSGATSFWLTLAGITHGLYASGGPLLVYGLSRKTLNKQTFRATLLATWLSLNAGYTLWFAINGTLSQHTETILMLLPVLLFAAVSGQFLHVRINEQQFKSVIYWLLILCGVIMLLQTWTA